MSAISADMINKGHTNVLAKVELTWVQGPQSSPKLS